MPVQGMWTMQSGTGLANPGLHELVEEGVRWKRWRWWLVMRCLELKREYSDSPYALGFDHGRDG